MGILNANNVLAEYLTNAEINLKDLDKTQNYDVAFDGSLLLFTGCTKSNLDIASDYDKTEAIATSATHTVRSIYYHLKSLGIPIFSMKLYFDGQRPSLKRITSQNRQTKSINFDRKAALSKFSTIASQRIDNLEIIALRVGEAENEFFLRRSRCRPTIFCTNDTDMFHLAYKAIDILEPNCYMYQLSRKQLRVYDLKIFNVADLSRNSLKLLLFCLGSDFTQPIISPSMFRALLIAVETTKDSQLLDCIQSLYNELENKYDEQFLKDLGTSPKFLRDTLNMVYDKSKVYEVIEYKITVDNVERSLLQLNRLFSYMRKHKEIFPKFTYCHQNKQIVDKTNINNDCENYSNCITWSVNYSNIGCSVKHYTDDDFAVMKPVDGNAYYKYLKQKWKF